MFSISDEQIIDHELLEKEMAQFLFKASVRLILCQNLLCKPRKFHTILPGMPFFLMENIGYHYSHNYEEEMNEKRSFSRIDEDRCNNDHDDKENDDLDSEEEELDRLDSELNVNDDKRLAQFQAPYRIEKTRQKELMLKEFLSLLTNGNDLNLDMDADEDDQVPLVKDNIFNYFLSTYVFIVVFGLSFENL